MTISQAQSWARQELKKAKIKSALIDAEILLSLTIKKPREFLYTHPEYPITKKQETEFKKFIKRRMKGEPVAYMLGYKEFYGLKFLVNKSVLIPRPETEMMVEEIVSRCQSVKCQDVLIDVGTGSGCISIAVVKNYSSFVIPDRLAENQAGGSGIQKKLRIVALDISNKALEVAKKNAKLHGVDKKIKFVKSDLLSFFLNIDCFKKNKIPPLPACRTRSAVMTKKEAHLIITANLPYLSENIYKENYKNLKFEPKNALVAEKDGLKYYRKLIKQIKIIISKKQDTISKNKEVFIFLEINPEQKNDIKKIIKNNLPKAEIEFKKDLAGLTRLVVVKLN